MPDIFEDGANAISAAHEVAMAATLSALEIYNNLWSLGYAVSEQQFFTMVFGLGWELPPKRSDTDITKTGGH